MREPPNEYVCAICLEVMTDPVLLETGQTYDRHCIVNWLCCGGCNCPKTGQRLKHGSLVPNVALRTLIQDWCNSNGLPFEKKNTGFVNPALLQQGHIPQGHIPQAEWCQWAGSQQCMGVPLDWWQQAAWMAWAQYCGAYPAMYTAGHVAVGHTTQPAVVGQPQWQHQPSMPAMASAAQQDHMQSIGGLFGDLACEDVRPSSQQSPAAAQPATPTAPTTWGVSHSGVSCISGLPQWLQPVAGAAASGQPLAAAVALPELSAIQSKVVLGRALLKALSALNVDINTGIAVFNRLKCSMLEDMLPAYAVLKDAWQRNSVADARNVIACIAGCR